MAKTKLETVDQYIASKSLSVQPALVRVRAVIRKALPHAKEVISYQIPAYRSDGGVIVFFAAWADHYSLYPVGESVIAAFRKELAPYELSHKGTVRFPYSRPVPATLITRIAKFLGKAAEGRLAAKSAKKSAAKKRKARPTGTKKVAVRRRAH